MEIRFLFGDSYTTIESNYITELKQEANLFSGETFYLGSTVCRSFALSIDRAAISAMPDDSVLIYEGDNKYADLVIDSIDDDDVKVYKFQLTDRMVRLNNPSVEWFTSGYTIQQLLNSICSKFGIISSTIPNYGNVAITWFDNWTARDFVSWVAELLGGYAYVSADNVLKFAEYSNTPAETIAVENCDSFKLGQQIIIDRVVYNGSSKTVKYPEEYSGTGCTLYLNIENQLFTDSGDVTIEAQVEYIYNIINGFTFYNVAVGKCPISASIRAGQTIGFALNSEVYNTIAQVNWNYNSMWLGGYDLDIDSPVQQETQIVGTMQKTLSITQKIDRELGEVSTTVSSVQEQADALETNVTSLTQDLSGFKTTVSNTYATKSALSTTNTNVSNLRSDLNTTNDNLDTLQGNLESTNNTITTIQENVSSVQQTTSSIQTQVSQTQTDLQNNYATKSELSSSVSSLSTTIQQTASDITLTISDVQDVISSQGQQITTLETYIRATSRGLEISRSSDEVTMVLSNTELGFYNKANTKLAWLDSADGLGASALSIGDATTASNRWRIFTRQSGSHLTFTRHS